MDINRPTLKPKFAPQPPRGDGRCLLHWSASQRYLTCSDVHLETQRTDWPTNIEIADGGYAAEAFEAELDYEAPDEKSGGLDGWGEVREVLAALAAASGRVRDAHAITRPERCVTSVSVLGMATLRVGGSFALQVEGRQSHWRFLLERPQQAAHPRGIR